MAETQGGEGLELLRASLLQMCAMRRNQGNRLGLIEVLKALLEVCLRLEDWTGAIAAAEELVALGAAHAKTWAGLGDARLNVGYAAGAAEAYRQAVALAPKEPMLRRNYAYSLIRAGRLAEASAQVDRAEKLEPGVPLSALHRAELAKARGDRVEALRWATEALRRQPGWDEAQAIAAWATAENP
jgi:Flp pilus assembly protein TadD